MQASFGGHLRTRWELSLPLNDHDARAAHLYDRDHIDLAGVRVCGIDASDLFAHM